MILMPTQTDYAKAVSVLHGGAVEFIIVGGVAAVLHGLGFTTYDLDVVYARNRENIRRLVQCLEPYEPYLRGAPSGLPFRFDEATVRNGLNFTLTTAFGDLDLLGEVIGAGSYRDLLPHSTEIQAFGVGCRCANLERLIQMKRAAGRPKDLEIIGQMQALLEERRRWPHASREEAQ
jgi:predicted nucleotidyltransferase